MDKTSYQQLELARASPQAIGDRICELRKSKEYTQATLSKACGISQQTIAALESVRVADPRHLPIIAQTLNVSVEYLRYGRSSGVPCLHNRATANDLPRPGVDVPVTTKMLPTGVKFSPRAFAFIVDDSACLTNHVLENDYVVVDPEVDPTPKFLVCVRYKGAFTVRRYKDLADSCEYISDNADYATLDDTNSEFIGTVIQLVRNYK